MYGRVCSCRSLPKLEVENMREVIDLTGKKFGKLAVVEISEKRGNYYYWKCICDCGNEAVIRGNRLTSGKTKSCGCLNKEIVSEKHLKDLTGQRFGRLKVLKRTRSERNNAVWLCECDCGNVKEIISANLIHGKTNSCGCLQREMASKLNTKRGNRYEICGDYVKVFLENSKEPMICDLDDWEIMKLYTWFSSNGYAATHKEKDSSILTYFHKEVVNRKSGFVIDHINRNSLDNRKRNLRVTTQQINTINRGIGKNNTSGIKGVHRRKDTGRWSATITLNHKTIYLGCYDTLKDADNARKIAEEKYFEPLLNS